MNTTEENPIRRSTEQWVQVYIESMSSKELKAYAIAKNHLESTFSIEKSVGFLKWLKKQQEQQHI